MALQPLFSFYRVFNLNRLFFILGPLLTLCTFSTYGISAEKTVYISAQYAALAPNAGGQTAYSLRYAKDDWELGGFSNQYLQAGGYPLTGAFYEKVFKLCQKDCFWQFNLQTGIGLSNGGPFTQISWSSVIPLIPIWLPFQAPKYVPALRLDMTTQMIFIPYRAITWSYPLWAGISYPF